MEIKLSLKDVNFDLKKGVNSINVKIRSTKKYLNHDSIICNNRHST